MAEQTTTVPVPVPARSGRMHRLGRWTALHPLPTMGAWLVLLVCAAFSAGYFSSHLGGNANAVTGSDSQAAAQLIERAFPDRPRESDVVVLHSSSVTVDDPAFHAVVSAALTRYRAAALVREVDDPYAAPDRLVSTDRRTALVVVAMDGTRAQVQAAAAPLQQLAAGLATNQVEAFFTGSAPLDAASVAQADEDLSTAEAIGLPAAAVVLLLAFSSAVAAAVPLTLGVVAVLGAFGLLGAASLVMTFDVFVRTAVSMVGIALGIDYSLFIVTRFREELAGVQGSSRLARAEAVGRTLATAGKAVLFSGTTVVVSLSGLWLVRSPKIHAMAVGMAAAVLVMLLISTTLLPALLGLLGERINRLALPWARGGLTRPDPERSAWARLADLVMRRPIVVAGVTTVLLGVLAIPVFGLRYGVDLGAGAVAQSPAGRGFTLVGTSFAPGVLTPVDVVVTTDGPALDDARLDALARLTDGLKAQGDISDVVSLTSVLDRSAGGHGVAALERADATAGAQLAQLLAADHRTTLITVRPQQAADTTTTAALVGRLRGVVRGALPGTGLVAHVGGSPAEIVDITDESSRAMPIVIAAVLAASFVLLLLAFRSLLLPFKAIVMNLLTSGAAFGLAVLVFQEGHGAGLLGVERTGFVQVVLPLFAFALVFGLSMDYEVFMLSRMREEWQRLGDNTRAVRTGMTHTARVITAAAGIMVVVFGAFMFTRVLEIKQMGFMLGVAVFIDASIVRLLLVPSLMRLMGAANWWVPRWLDRILPRVDTGD